MADFLNDSKITDQEKPKPADPIQKDSDASFRNRIATMDDDGNRSWIYPKKPKGKYHRARAIVASILLAVFFFGPYIEIGGHPLLLLNVIKRQFVIFGQPFFPQDFHLFVLAMIAVFVFILLFTVVYGRLWCGWTCPQTVFMEMVFRKIEFLIEGGPAQQKALNKRPLDGDKFLRKSLKHSIFILISLAVSNTFVAYLIGKEAFLEKIVQSPFTSPAEFSGTLIFAGIFYLIFAKFREQACTLVCPYGRLQGALLDKNSIVVSYDWSRGEPRMPLKKAKTFSDPGHCIDCNNCVKVCPTGIDIRNGTQLECVNCTACMDACDSIMLKTKKPQGLIRYASYNSIENGGKQKLDIRMIGYTFVLVLLVGLLSFLLATRSPIETTMLRTPGTLYYRNDDGSIRNLYSLKIVNKTYNDITANVKIIEPEKATIEMIGNSPLIPSQGVYEGACLITLPAGSISETKTALKLEVISNGKKLESIKTSFMGPVSPR